MFRLVCASTFAVALAAQQEIWVDPVLGNNLNLGTYTQPLQSLTAAVGIAGPGARIFLLPGVYGPSQTGEQLPIQIGAAPQQGLEIRGLGNAILDLNGSTMTALRLINGANGLRLTNLTIRNHDQTQWWTRVINSGGGAGSGNSAMNVEIDRCKFIDINRGLVLWTQDNVTGWRVHDNLFVNCTNDAILEYTGTNEFFHNTFHTGSFKAYISDSQTSICYDNLVVAYNIGFEVNNASSPTSRFQGNWLYQCTTPTGGVGMAGGLPGTNVIGVDPRLVNPAGGDYHLQPTSPLIDAGVPTPFARADLDTNSRIVDGDLDGILEPDVGCYEVTHVHLAVNWDLQNRLMWIDGTGTIPGTFAFVIFSFDDGLVNFPGQGPILVDQASFVPFYLVGPLPQQWVLGFQNYVAPPGQRLVMQILGVGPNHQGSALWGGNQVWVNF
ncbi:MAG: DUF1565 domain-containing protein [Planctomycetes bacterium]|nr:DUF1565 domain-containing protein [Planctomycetota bacterium]